MFSVGVTINTLHYRRKLIIIINLIILRYFKFFLHDYIHTYIYYSYFLSGEGVVLSKLELESPPTSTHSITNMAIRHTVINIAIICKLVIITDNCTRCRDIDLANRMIGLVDNNHVILLY